MKTCLTLQAGAFSCLRPLADILMPLPFARELIEDVPILLDLEWKSINTHVDAELRSTKKNRLIIELDMRGLFDLKFVSSLEPASDRMFFESIIQRLQECGGEALLFARSSVVPPHPDDGFDLWIMRPDGGNRKSRICLREILKSHREELALPPPLARDHSGLQ